MPFFTSTCSVALLRSTYYRAGQPPRRRAAHAGRLKDLSAIAAAAMRMTFLCARVIRKAQDAAGLSRRYRCHRSRLLGGHHFCLSSMCSSEVAYCPSHGQIIAG